METIESMLRTEMWQLKKIAEQAEKRLKTAPQGSLRISKKKNHVEYYYRNEAKNAKNGNGRYLKKNEVNLAKRIAQRDYDVRILKSVTKRVKLIESFIENY